MYRAITMLPSPVTYLALLLLPLIAAWLLLRRNAAAKPKLRLAPGPRGLPIVGHLHLLSSRLHCDLARLARTYGPIMQLRFGLLPAVVISSPSAAHELFKSHDLAISGRVHMQASDLVAYHSRGLGSSQYGPYYRGVRKLFTTELLSAQRVSSLAPMRREELHLLVDALEASAKAREAVDVTARLSYLITDIACRMVFGNKGDSGRDAEEVRGIRWKVREGARLLATLNLGDYIPWIASLDLQGLRPRMRAVREATDGFLGRVMERRRRLPKGEEHNVAFLDIMLSFLETPAKKQRDFDFDDDSVKALSMEILGAMVEPIATTLEWALSELISHPEVMKKLQKELEDVVGRQRMVEESDLEKLRYLDMVVKESMRLHMPTPLLTPRRAVEDLVLNGYHIPRDSQVIINAWAIGRDPEAWPDPERFSPERFLDSDVDVKGQDFELIPFGAGRRGCPGMHLGLPLVKLVLAQLTHCFDWELPDDLSPSELDMEDAFGVTAPRAKHLHAVPTYRLHKRKSHA